MADPNVVAQRQGVDVNSILNEAYQKEQEEYNNIEKKRLQYINKLTLAERLGLVDKPAQPLSQTQWRGIEKQFLDRANLHESCPICIEDL